MSHITVLVPRPSKTGDRLPRPLAALLIAALSTGLWIAIIETAGWAGWL